MSRMVDEAPNVDDIRDTVITQIVEGGYVTAVPLVVLSLYLFVQGYRRLSLIKIGRAHVRTPVTS